MNSKVIRWGMAGMTVLALLASAIAAAAENTVGKSEFLTHCAMCHGQEGKGDGWLGDNLIKHPPSLRQLKNNNGGVFPLAKVIEVIDGRKAVSLHGPREMPIWGEIYRAEEKAANAARPAVLSSEEKLVRAKIRALANYILELQD